MTWNRFREWKAILAASFKLLPEPPIPKEEAAVESTE